MITKTFNFQNPYNVSVAVTFDETSNDPVLNILKRDIMWGLDTYNISKIFTSPFSYVVDIGAHIGTFSLLSSIVGACNVIAIEASPHNFAYLKINKEGNPSAKLAIHNLAASDTEAMITIQERGSGSHISTHKDDLSKSSTIQAQPLDSVLSNLPRLDFVKLDVEGYELKTLIGMSKTLERFRPPIFFEVNGHTLDFFDKTPNDLLRLLEKRFGYRIFFIGQSFIPMNCFDPFPFGVCDCMAVTEEQIAKLRQFAPISLPLTFTQRQTIIGETYQCGNDDIKRYITKYQRKIKLQLVQSQLEIKLL